MVRLSIVNLVQAKVKSALNLRKKPFYNHRVPLEYKHFQSRINEQEIVERYSRDEYSSEKDGAEQSVVIENNFLRTSLLPDITAEDLKRNQIFQDELDRQRNLTARIEKIKVLIDSEPGHGKLLMMNKNLSTPFDCARHVNELLVTRSAVAELLPSDDDVKEKKSTYWDMHRPLKESCKIRFRHFDEEDIYEVNKSYWRSCSFLLGIAIRRAFKDNIKVMLHSWPKPDIRSGSFVYDVALNLKEKWTPSDQELRAFSKILWDICEGRHKFERLTTSPEIATQIFDNNNFKIQQIQDISQKNQDRHGSKNVDLYRCGGYIDISVGPMISHTGQVGRISLASVHQFDQLLDTDENDAKGLFYRFQGVSLPRQLAMNSFVYQNILLNRARKLNHSH